MGTEEQMTKLDAIQQPAVRTPTRCRRQRDGRQLACAVYAEPSDATVNSMKDELPSKSYMDCIVQGMLEHGCPKAGIDKVSAIRTDKAPPAREYMPLQYDNNLPKWTLKKLADMAAAGEHVYSVNGKVIKYEGPEQGVGWEVYKDHFGKEMMLESAQTMYCPLFDTPSRIEDMTEEQRAYWEHELGGKFQAQGAN